MEQFEGGYIQRTKYCKECGQEKALFLFEKERNVCKECKKRYYRNWRIANREKLNKDKLLWKINHREQNRRSNRISAARARFCNPEKSCENARRYRERHPEKAKETQKKWTSVYGADRCAARRSKTRANGGKITGSEWRELKEKYNHTCLCCGRKEPEIKLTLDHIIPIALGGPNVIENVQPLCKSCNCKKHKSIIDYRPKSEPIS